MSHTGPQIDPNAESSFNEALDKLRADYEKSGVRADGSQIDPKGGGEAAEAARYRWLREQSPSGPYFIAAGTALPWDGRGDFGAFVDAAVDAARGLKEGGNV